MTQAVSQSSVALIISGLEDSALLRIPMGVLELLEEVPLADGRLYEKLAMRAISKGKELHVPCLKDNIQKRVCGYVHRC